MFIRYKKSKELPIKPVTCPRCKGKEISFVTEYHKSLTCRTFEVIIIATIIGIFIDKFENSLQGVISDTGFIIPILAFFLICTEIAKHYIESKTNIQCVCKNCGWVWLHNLT